MADSQDGDHGKKNRVKSFIWFIDSPIVHFPFKSVYKCIVGELRGFKDCTESIKAPLGEHEKWLVKSNSRKF